MTPRAIKALVAFQDRSPAAGFLIGSLNVRLSRDSYCIVIPFVVIAAVDQVIEALAVDEAWGFDHIPFPTHIILY